MVAPSFSPATVKALVDVITGGSGGMYSNSPPIGIYRTASAIEGLMMECDLDFQVGGSRVPSLTQFLRDLLSSDPEGGSKLVRIIVRVVEPDDYAAQPERRQAAISHLNRFLGRDGLEIVLRNDQPQLIEARRSGGVVSTVAAKAATINFDTVQRDLERALASSETDAEDAVTAACSTIESVCRSILVELGVPLPAKKDIEGLMRAIQEPLALSPARTDLPTEIAADVRQVLGGLTTTAKGIGALRTHGGDAHGRERGFKRIDGRIARLAIHTASTVTLFLIETWERKYRRPLPEATDKVPARGTEARQGGED